MTDALTPEEKLNEDVLLACVLIDGKALEGAVSVVQPWHFRMPLHRSAYTAALSLHSKDMPVDLANLAGELKELNREDHFSPAMLAEFLDPLQNVSPRAWKYYADQVREAGQRYRLQKMAMDVARRAKHESIDDLCDELSTQAKAVKTVFSPVLRGLDGLCAPDTPLREPVIHHLLRAGEVMNLVAETKIGKSWLVTHLGLCFVTGQPLFGQIPVEPGEILVIDNELHPETLNDRFETVARAMGLRREEYRPFMHPHCFRGQQIDIDGLIKFAERIPHGRIKAVIIDAKYRLERPGASENDNASVTAFYNAVDALALRLGAAIVLVHHSTKGDQGDKKITDIGAGGGAQSRAVDCHAVIREHETEGCSVFEASVRSFRKFDPLVLRFNWPLWTVESDLNPKEIKTQLSKQQAAQQRKDEAAIDSLKLFLMDGPQTERAIREHLVCGYDRVNRLMLMMKKRGLVCSREVEIKSKPATEYWLADQEPPGFIPETTEFLKRMRADMATPEAV